MNELQGVIKSVISGDTFVLTHPTKLPPVEKTIFLAGVDAPKLARKDKPEEPFAFAARELVRKMCIGKLVTFNVLYTSTKTKKDYASIFVDKQNIALVLVKAGLAKVTENIHKKQKPTEEEKALLEAEKEAKSKHLGIWSHEDKKKAAIRNVSWKNNLKELFKQYKGKPVDVIVEVVLNGSTLKVLLPSNQIVTLGMTGISCPPMKTKDSDQPPAFSKEAKHFTESRLLHRDVSILFEGVDTEKDTMYGSILMNKTSTFQEELLSKGFARISQLKMYNSKFVPQFRAAEQKAKNAKLRLWHDYEAPPETKKPGDEKEFTAKIIEVLSGDTLKIINEKDEEERISLSSVRAPRFGPKGKKPEPFAMESKLFLMSKLAGKKVVFKTDYRRTLELQKTEFEKEKTKGKKGVKKTTTKVEEERRFVTVLANGKNVAIDLVQQGYASVIRHRQDEEKSNYFDQLIVAEKTAQKQGRGIHTSKKKLPNFLLNDLTFSTAGQTAKYFAIIRDKRVKAVVDKVHAGHRFRIYMPKESLLLTFTLSGITCSPLRQRDGKVGPFAKEALDYSINQVLFREVDVLIEHVDRVGTFVGTMFLNDKPYQLKLLEEGLATLGRVAKRFKNYQELADAEKKAENAKKGLWSVPEFERKKPVEKEEKPKERQKYTFQPYTKKENLRVRVTEVVDASHLFLQTADAADKLAKIGKLIHEVKDEKYTPQVGGLCLAKFSGDGNWYRAKVLQIQGDNITVFYVDFGNSEVVKSSHLKPITEELTKIEPQAKEAFLAFIKLPDKAYKDSKEFGFIIKEAKKLVEDFCIEHGDLIARLEYTENGRTFINLFDGQGRQSINSTLVRYGYALVTRQREIVNNELFAKEIEELDREMFAARRDQAGMWEYEDMWNIEDNYEDEM